MEQPPPEVSFSYKPCINSNPDCEEKLRKLFVCTGQMNLQLAGGTDSFTS